MLSVQSFNNDKKSGFDHTSRKVSRKTVFYMRKESIFSPGSFGATARLYNTEYQSELPNICFFNIQ